MSEERVGVQTGASPTPGLSLVEQVEAQIRSGQVSLPVLPETVFKARDLIENDAQVSQVVAVIEREPGLAAALLRYANSVAFAGLDELSDLHQVVARLGMSATEQVVVAASVKNVFHSPDPADAALLRRMWGHASAVALASRRVADLTSAADPESAYLAGLLHDIGKIVLLRAIADVKKRDPRRHLSEATLLAVFDSLHCVVGEELFEAWKLPPAIREVARHHHDPDLSPFPPLVTVVALGDHVAARLGESLKPDGKLAVAETPAARAFGLDEAVIEHLLASVQEDIRRAKAPR
jgi:putative nucleotidyltransferase with HDIG domain